MKANSIASVTVCYNGASELPQHLDALLCQDRALQEIIVVNNGSTDHTREVLERNYPQVTALSLPENVGVGGGFTAGLSHAAIAVKHDWVWLFDHDSRPRKDAARNLCQAMESLGDSLDEIGMFASVGVHPETNRRYLPQFWRDGFVKASEELLRQPIWFADFAMSSGSLISREVVEAVGLPRADFFMDAVDFEYCLRIRSRGYKIAVVNSSELAHAMGNPTSVKRLGVSKIRGGQPPWREYYLARNVVYVVWWLYPTGKAKRYMFRFLAKHACGILLFESHKLACLKKVFQGFDDGRRARLGVRFRPSA